VLLRRLASAEPDAAELAAPPQCGWRALDAALGDGDSDGDGDGDGDGKNAVCYHARADAAARAGGAAPSALAAARAVLASAAARAGYDAALGARALAAAEGARGAAAAARGGGRPWAVGVALWGGEVRLLVASPARRRLALVPAGDLGVAALAAGGADGVMARPGDSDGSTQYYWLDPDR
jgi:hypothetical protein